MQAIIQGSDMARLYLEHQLNNF